MTTVNMLEAKTNLSKLVKMLETKEEDIIYIARDGTEVAQLTLVPKSDSNKRIGEATGRFALPDNFDDIFDGLDKEIENAFEGGDTV